MRTFYGFQSTLPPTKSGVLRAEDFSHLHSMTDFSECFLKHIHNTHIRINPNHVFFPIFSLHNIHIAPTNSRITLCTLHHDFPPNVFSTQHPHSLDRAKHPTKQALFTPQPCPHPTINSQLKVNPICGIFSPLSNPPFPSHLPVEIRGRIGLLRGVL